MWLIVGSAADFVVIVVYPAGYLCFFSSFLSHKETRITQVWVLQ